MLEFTERYRMAMAADEQVERIPAWVCDECPHVVFVRAEHQPAALRATARRARAAATRRLMTARTVRVRADGVLRKSMSRKKRR